MHKHYLQHVPVTSTSATWDCVYLCLPGVMATWIVLTEVTSYLDVTAVSEFMHLSVCWNNLHYYRQEWDCRYGRLPKVDYSILP